MGRQGTAPKKSRTEIRAPENALGGTSHSDYAVLGPKNFVVVSGKQHFEMEKLSIFVDTNAFIHLRDMKKDIPWRDCYDQARQVDLIVISSVIRQLEGIKTGVNDRKRNRARAALALIDEAMDVSDMAIVLREANPTVRLRVGRGVEKGAMGRFSQSAIGRRG